MSRWEKVQLGDVCKSISDGSHNPPKGIEFSDFIMLSSKNISNDKITFDEPRYLTEADFIIEDRRTKITKGDVLLTIVGTIGRTAVISDDSQRFTLQRSVAVLKPMFNIIDSRYLMYAIINITPQLEQEARGVAQKGIYLGQVKEVLIPLPPLETQKKIAEVLDMAQELIDKRKQQIELLDKFLQSVFIEIFGDPVINPKGWVEKLIIDCCDNKDDIKCGPFGTQLNKTEFQRNGVPLWGIAQINSQFRTRPLVFLTVEKAEELSDYSIEENDIVMSRKGTVGKCALFPTGLPKGVMHSDVLRIRTAKNIVNPHFFCSQLRISKKVERQIAVLSQGAIMAGINVGKLKSIIILVPPLDLQNKFAEIVVATERQRELMERSLALMEQNLKGLMQRAFRGELFN